MFCVYTHANTKFYQEWKGYTPTSFVTSAL